MCFYINIDFHRLIFFFSTFVLSLYFKLFYHLVLGRSFTDTIYLDFYCCCVFIFVSLSFNYYFLILYLLITIFNLCIFYDHWQFLDLFLISYFISLLLLLFFIFLILLPLPPDPLKIQHLISDLVLLTLKF